MISFLTFPPYSLIIFNCNSIIYDSSLKEKIFLIIQPEIIIVLIDLILINA